MSKLWVKHTIVLGLIVIILMISVPASIYAYNSYSYNQLIKSADILLEEENFDDAISKYNKSLSYKNETDYINEKINKAEKLKKSKANFDKATQFYAENEYFQAIEFYMKVDALDAKYYERSQDIITKYKTDSIINAKQEASKQKYTEAISYLDIILEIEPDNIEVTTLKDKYNHEITKLKEERARIEAEKKAKEQVAQKEKIQRPALPGQKVISLSGPFSLSVIETKLNGIPVNKLFIQGPKDSRGSAISGVAQSNTGFFKGYQGKMDEGYYLPGYVERRDNPPGTAVKIGFSIEYKGKKYSLGGSVNTL